MNAIRTSRAWIVGGAVAAVAVIAGGYFLLISPQLDATSGSQQQLADAQVQNVVLQKRLDTLREKSGTLDQLRAELGGITAAVPPRHDVEGFTRQLTAFAADAGVTITAITPASPVAVTLPEATTQPAAPTGNDAPSTTTETAQAAEPPAPSATPTGPAGSLYSIAVTVVSNGPMAAQRAFLSAIETKGDRRALVMSTAFSPLQEQAAPTEIAVTTTVGGPAPTTTAAPQVPSATEGQWSLTTQLSIFVAPQSPDQEAQLLDQLGGNG